MKTNVPPVEIEGPVTGKTIQTFQLVFGLTMVELCEILSIPRPAIKAVMEQDPVKDVAVAVLVRFYFKHPDRVPRLRDLNMANVYQRIGGEKTVRVRMFSVPLGRDSGAGYNWVNRGFRASDQPLDMAEMIMRSENPTAQYFEFFDAAREEAAARGVNPFLTGSWSKEVPEKFSAANITPKDILEPLPKGRASILAEGSASGRSRAAKKGGRVRKERS